MFMHPYAHTSCALALVNACVCMVSMFSGRSTDHSSHAMTRRSRLHSSFAETVSAQWRARRHCILKGLSYGMACASEACACRSTRDFGVIDRLAALELCIVPCHAMARFFASVGMHSGGHRSQALKQGKPGGPDPP